MRAVTLELLAACLVAFASGPAASGEDTSEADTKAFFNGKDLEGWEGLEKYWSVKDGALVGSTPEDPKHNTFLCSKKKYRDFELSFKVRLKGGAGNSGVQIRSRVVDPKWFAVAGPQCDIGEGYWGSLYGEDFGGMMQKAPEDVVAKVLKKDDFNDYSIRCAGTHVTIKINGQTTVDGDFDKKWSEMNKGRDVIPDEGIIAWQLHSGHPGMEVTFKDVKFKNLGAK